MSKRDEVWVMLSSLFLFGERRESLGGQFRFARRARGRNGAFLGFARRASDRKGLFLGLARAASEEKGVFFAVAWCANYQRRSFFIVSRAANYQRGVFFALRTVCKLLARGLFLSLHELQTLCEGSFWLFVKGIKGYKRL